MILDLRGYRFQMMLMTIMRVNFSIVNYVRGSHKIVHTALFKTNKMARKTNEITFTPFIVRNTTAYS